MEASSADDPNVALDDLLVYENLAFSTPRPDGSGTNDGDVDGDNGWIEAVAVVRAPFAFRDDGGYSKDVLLNVELFGDPSWPRILLFVHGVCESAETWTVQNLATICASRRWRMAVLELEGHGLSEGVRGLIGRSWKKCVRQVQGFCHHALKVDRAQKQAQTNEGDDPKPITKFVLAGASLGGALAAYASQAIRNDDPPASCSFVGTLLLSPAVGVDPSVVPPPYIVTALSVLAWIMPAVGIEGVTPTEDPSHYNCPFWTNRNFQGPWPLETSKLLLDVTSKIIPRDVESGSLNLLHQRTTTVTTTNPSKYAIRVISGDKDPVVPIQAVRDFVDGMKAKAQEEQQENTNDTAAATFEIIEIQKGDHGLLAQSVEDPDIGTTKKKTTNATIEQVLSFLKQCEGMDIMIQ